MSTISASAARQSLPAQLDLVERGEEVEITRHGRVVAVLVHPDVLKSRRAPAAWNQATHIEALIEKARSEPLAPATLHPQQADDLVESVRSDRAAR